VVVQGIESPLAGLEAMGEEFRELVPLEVVLSRPAGQQEELFDPS